MREVKVQPIQSLERAIHIMNCFSFERFELTIDEIMKQTGLAKATVYRLLWTLEKNNLVHYNTKENVYRLGAKLLEYGGIVLENLDIRREAEPYLWNLHDSTKQTVLLAVRQQDTIQYLLRFDSDDGFQPLSYVGRRRILHYGAMGMIYMAFLPEHQAKEIVKKHPLTAHTPYTVTDEKLFFERLEQIREKGYFVDVDETFVGFTAVAVPVLDSRGEVAAVIGMAGPSFKYEGEAKDRFIEQTIQTAYNVSKQLGFVGTYR